MQTINSDKVMLESDCEETHIFRPFSKGQNGAATTVKAKLRFTREYSGVSGREGMMTIYG